MEGQLMIFLRELLEMGFQLMQLASLRLQGQEKWEIRTKETCDPITPALL